MRLPATSPASAYRGVSLSFLLFRRLGQKRAMCPTVLHKFHVLVSVRGPVDVDAAIAAFPALGARLSFSSCVAPYGQFLVRAPQRPSVCDRTGSVDSNAAPGSRA